MPTRRAKYPSTCRLCRKAIRGETRPLAADGEEIAKMNRFWVHLSCMERKMQGFGTTALEEHRGDADRPQMTYIKSAGQQRWNERAL